jgi:hypothetical protein
MIQLDRCRLLLPLSCGYQRVNLFDSGMEEIIQDEFNPV